MKKILFGGLLIVASFGLTSCATITKGTSADVRVNSTPSGAQIYSNNVLKGETPTTLTLSRKSDHVLEFRKEGYNSVYVEVNRKFDVGTTVFGNIVFGGLIGLIIDTANGSAYSLSPADLEINLEELAQAGYIKTKNIGEDDIQVIMLTQEEWNKLTAK